jgi:hypothetical protein
MRRHCRLTATKSDLQRAPAIARGLLHWEHIMFETDVIGQAELARQWSEKARAAFDAGDMERAVELQDRGRISGGATLTAPISRG